MNIESKEENEVLIGYIQGEVDVNSAPDFKKKLEALLTKQNKKILINFEGMNYIDSSGLATLVDFFKAIKGYGGQLVFCSLLENVKKLFVITRLDKLFNIVDTKQQAMEIFG